MPKRKRTASSPEEDVVNMSTLRQLLDDQEEVFNIRMKQQERKYESFVKTTNKRLDDLEVAKTKGLVSTSPPSPSYTMPKRKRNVTASSNEEDVVNMSTLRELLDDQKKAFTDRMKQQEKKYESFVKTTNDRVYDLTLEDLRVKGTRWARSREKLQLELTKTPAYRLLKDKVQDMDREISKLRADTSRTGKVKGSDTWRLSVNGIDGETYALQVHKDATVDMVFKKISRRHGVPPDGLRIVYDGKQLQHLAYGKQKYLSEYGVRDKSTLYVVENQGPPPKLSIPKQLDSSESDSDDIETSTDASDTDEDTETTDASVMDEDIKTTFASDDYDRKTTPEASRMDKRRNFWWLSVSGTDGKTYVLKVRKDATVEKLCEKISEKKGTHPTDLCIVYEGERLDSGKYLSDYDVKNRSTLFVVERKGLPQYRLKDLDDTSDEDDWDVWELFVHTLSAPRLHVIRIRRDATVNELYKKISEKSSIPLGQFHTLYKNRKMEFGLGKCLADYGVQDSSSLILRLGGDPWKEMALTGNTSVRGVDYGSNIWQLFIHTHSRQITVRIHKDSSVDKLYEVVSYWTGVPVQDQHIVYTIRMEPLERGQGKSLLDYNMKDQSFLHVVQPDLPVADQILRLFVKGLTGKTKIVFIRKDATSDELHEMASQMYNIPVRSMRIIYTTKQLEYGGGKYLSDYNMQDNSTLFIVLRLLGGGVGKCPSRKS